MLRAYDDPASGDVSDAVAELLTNMELDTAVSIWIDGLMADDLTIHRAACHALIEIGSAALPAVWN
jgi:HEAT repeat protein